MGGFAAGTLATFKTDNEIGTSALLLIGGISSLIALLGRVPRIKVGENEIDPSEIYQAGFATGVGTAVDAAADVAVDAVAKHKSAEEVGRAVRSAGRFFMPLSAALPNPHREFNWLLRLPNGENELAVRSARRNVGPDSEDGWHYFTLPDFEHVASQVGDYGDIVWEEDFKRRWNATHPESLVE
ncbi:hypothetical protein SAMN05421872_101575 [Nocardioides lianchengensis]|uniref:Uncharacterized protein n=2 Tax=Nocardioides lianchengensis TaxID=1045774 RepID=A0A1G6JT53_9ACTN|nr:hypothetical protein SAMN05421872_101575 [Nocardioides lianchengensis]